MDNLLRPDFGSRLEVRNRNSACRHVSIVVDQSSRCVECKVCGAILDPVDILVQFATDERKLQYSRDELVKIRGELKKLKDEERRVKLRIQRVRTGA